MMKKYEYVNVRFSGLFVSGPECHRQLIDEYAQKGWRYVGFIPTSQTGYGAIRTADLIFETDIAE